MNALESIRHAEKELVASIDAATAAVGQVGTGAVQAALDRYKKAVDDAKRRLHAAASVVRMHLDNLMFDALAAAQKIDRELPIPKADAPATGEGPFAAAELAPAVQYRPQDYAAVEEAPTPAAPAARAKDRRSGTNGFHQRNKGKS